MTLSMNQIATALNQLAPSEDIKMARENIFKALGLNEEEIAKLQSYFFFCSVMHDTSALETLTEFIKNTNLTISEKFVLKTLLIKGNNSLSGRQRSIKSLNKKAGDCFSIEKDHRNKYRLNFQCKLSEVKNKILDEINSI